MSAAETIDHANKAKAVLDNPAYSGAYDAVRAAIIERIEKCPLSDTQVAEDLRRCLKLLRDVQLNMVVAMNSGKVEAFRLAEDEKRKENKFRNLFR
jgi:hypothetical protein